MELPYFQAQVATLQNLLDATCDRRVCVVGTTCIGKSTLVKSLRGVSDLDELLFPLLTREEQNYVCQKPWTPEIGHMMMHLAKERVALEPGNPVFGTVVLASDYLIHLRITDYLLQQRVVARGKNYEDVKNMQAQIDTEVKQLKIPKIEFLVG